MNSAQVSGVSIFLLFRACCMQTRMRWENRVGYLVNLTHNQCSNSNLIIECL